MLKSCATCSYIGNDAEHICPFCKGELAVGKLKRSTGGSSFGRSNGSLAAIVTRCARCNGSEGHAIDGCGSLGSNSSNSL